jgi:hypothetical protein
MILLFSFSLAFAAFNPSVMTDQVPTDSRSGAYRVHIDYMKFRPELRDDPKLWYGFQGWTEPVLVRKIEIYYRGKRIDVPRSVYADLANVDTLAVETRKRGCVVLVEGGDAADSYRLTIKVTGEHVDSRDLRDGEFPDNYWEKTIYHDDPTGIE